MLDFQYEPKGSNSIYTAGTLVLIPQYGMLPWKPNESIQLAPVLICIVLLYYIQVVVDAAVCRD